MFLILSANNLNALDLIEAYNKAKIHDPEYLSVYYEYRASLTLPQQAISRVLPQISVNYTISNYRFLTAPLYYSDYGADARTFSMQQSIFNLPLLIEIKQADLRTKLAELRLKNAELYLMKKVSEAYFDLLFAEESLKVINEEKKAIQEQLKMIEKLFKAGEASLTDVHDAQAKLSDVLYRVVDAEKQLYTKRKNLAIIIGEEPERLAILPDEIPFEEPIPSTVDEWINIAKENSPVILFYKVQKDIAEDEIKKQRAQRLPAINLFANYTRTNTRDYLRVEPLSYVSFGLQITMTLFSGGYISAKEIEAKEKFEQAIKEYENAVSNTSQNIVENFFGVKSSIAGIFSGKTALLAATTAVESTKKGYIAGVRTFVDILNAESNLYRAKLNLIKSYNEYIKSLISLKFYTGNLKVDDLAKINDLLKKR